MLKNQQQKASSSSKKRWSEMKSDDEGSDWDMKSEKENSRQQQRVTRSAAQPSANSMALPQEDSMYKPGMISSDIRSTPEFGSGFDHLNDGDVSMGVSNHGARGTGSGNGGRGTAATARVHADVFGFLLPSSDDAVFVDVDTRTAGASLMGGSSQQGMANEHTSRSVTDSNSMGATGSRVRKLIRKDSASNDSRFMRDSTSINRMTEISEYGDHSSSRASTPISQSEAGSKDWALRVQQRKKQIDMVKAGDAYKAYAACVPPQNRKSGDPATPVAAERCGKRQFDGRLNNWRKLVHLWFEQNGSSASATRTRSRVHEA